ncbi:MAG: protein phosphatase 2C domain-containing protein, partial [Deinococcales bacterium]
MKLMEAAPPISKKGVSQAGTQVRFAGLSDTGKVRSINQDSFFVDFLAEKGLMAMVADGMGGHKNGEIASRMAVDAVTESFKQEKLLAPMAIAKAVHLANKSIYDYAVKLTGRQGMGTT